ncbi:hypothetical protein [Paractinoplanes toevensis]|uniref:hypothetical protein n=1 Tax=Paractinoplanes toevensis TaxID=571911 RepID=UPI001BB380A6|nr:hypothetical protein [Actinoplanes toevensis]
MTGTRDKTPIPTVRAATLTKAWKSHWHTDLEVVQNDVVRVQRTTVDYPTGHGKLTLSVQQEGTGTNPSPSLVRCTLADNSLGTGFVKLTDTLVGKMVSDCWGAVLAPHERTQIADWLLANYKLDKYGVNRTQAFARFAVRLEAVPTSVSLYLLAK